jgi:hypothetical protein
MPRLPVCSQRPDTCAFSPIADISNLFELFFTQNYLHTLTLRVPCLDYRHVPSDQTHMQIPRLVCRHRGLIAPTMILYVWKALTK